MSKPPTDPADEATPPPATADTPAPGTMHPVDQAAQKESGRDRADGGGYT